MSRIPRSLSGRTWKILGSRSAGNMKPNKLVVFDMDGVIIDVSGSYRDTVRRTAGLFFSLARAAQHLPDPLFQPADLADLKQNGGLNNDWDLTYLIISLLFSLVDKAAVYQNNDPWLKYRQTMSRCDAGPLAVYLKSTDRPLKTLFKRLGRQTNPFIAELYAGDVGSGNVIKQIFQEIYLGRGLFTSTYRLAPEMYRGEGYILREKVLVDRAILEELAGKNILAIATGRPKAEAEYPLNRFDLKKYFSCLYTLNDCLREEKRILAEENKTVSLSKPNPFMLDAVAETLKDKADRYYYVGDMPDDMVAAGRSRSGFKAIGLILAAPDRSALRRELTRAGADFIVEDFEELKKLLKTH
jgi:phosphoglycolate phosphatase-like HAD superfamily hydrolase